MSVYILQSFSNFRVVDHLSGNLWDSGCVYSMREYTHSLSKILKHILTLDKHEFVSKMHQNEAL